MADFTITTSPVNSNTWLNQQSLYVCGYTRIRVQCTPAQGSSFSSYDVIIGSDHYTGADITSSVWSAGRSDVQPYINVHATGSSGSVYKRAYVTMLGYAKPMLTTFNAERGTYTNGTWTSSPSGAHIRVEAVPTISLSTQGNTATVTIKIGNTSPDATSGNYYYFTSTSASTSYTITGTATDLLLESTTQTISVASAEVPFNVDVDIPGAAFGKVSETSRVVEIAPNWALNANGKHNTSFSAPYSFRTNGGASTLGWARIARVTATGSPTVNQGNPSIVFIVQARTLTRATLQANFNGKTLMSRYVDVTGNNWLCNPNRADSYPFVQTISSSATVAVYDFYFPKGYAEDELTVYTECSAELQDTVTIEYSSNLLSSKPVSDVTDFALAPLRTLTVSNLTVAGELTANGKNNQFNYMPYSWATGYSSGNNGYTRIATIEITGTYASEPITFVVRRMLDKRPVTLYLSFANENSTDPSTANLYYDDVIGTSTDNYQFAAFVYKLGTSTWGVFVWKSNADDIIDVTTHVPLYMQSRCNISYIQSRLGSVPSGVSLAQSLGFNSPLNATTAPIIRFQISANSTKRITGTSNGECAWLLGCTGWNQSVRSGLYFIAGYSDSSRADVTAIKTASGITITAVSGQLAWDIKNNQTIAVLCGLTSLYGAMPTIT